MRVHVQVVLVKQAALLDMQLDVILIVASRTSAFAVLSRSRQRFWKLASITKALWQPKYNDSLMQVCVGPLVRWRVVLNPPCSL